MNRKQHILFAVILACLAMAFVETVIRPGYAVKSCIKLLLFTGTVYALGVRGLFRREGLGLGIAWAAPSSP